MREAGLAGPLPGACNSLHTNKMQRPDRNTKSQNINETLSLQSTIEFFMFFIQEIDFTNRGRLRTRAPARQMGIARTHVLGGVGFLHL